MWATQCKKKTCGDGENTTHQKIDDDLWMIFAGRKGFSLFKPKTSTFLELPRP
jgi:hypothetical protein